MKQWKNNIIVWEQNLLFEREKSACINPTHTTKNTFPAIQKEL